MVPPYQAILLIAFGGPDSPGEIRPFLARVTQGIPIPTQRLEEVARHYEAVGGKSPLNEITSRQAQSLEKVLSARGTKLRVYMGLRNSSPFFTDALKRMANDGVKRALGFILSSHRTEASWERYQENIADARTELGEGAPTIEYCDGWHDHPLFIQTWAERINSAWAAIDSNQRDETPIIFTAHSLPTVMAARSPYVEQLTASASLIAKKLNHYSWSLAYQSRSGKPTEPWLEPDIGEALRQLADQGRKQIVVAPIGFVCDHVEVLYDLDIEARGIADRLNIRMIRARCPNDYPIFVQMIAEVIEQKIKAEDRE